MAVVGLQLRDFRCFDEARIALSADGVTVIRGSNGAGKTSVLEAIGWLAAGRSWRASDRSALVRNGTETARIGAELRVKGRVTLVQATVPRQGASRVVLDGQPLRTRRVLAEQLRVVVAAPSDVRLVTDGPAERRGLLDDLLVLRSARAEQARRELERCLRQRGALLQQARGRLDPATLRTLEVWDERLAEAGTLVASMREALASELAAACGPAHSRLAPAAPPLGLRYRRSWDGPLLDALAAAREEDLRRQTTSVGPHRDDLELMLGGRPARSEASQGEQRTIALALRLGAFALLAREDLEPPVLLLDDVFAELDDQRARALVEELPRDGAQVLLTTTTAAPPAVPVTARLRLDRGRVEADAA
ncbi:DNA replication/repair protein RecF [Aciditerrimonas ferrireducens]|uniref:DNA replication/repair protein RecF n=1 Tax=Aciditerrimonas ferrireducens TaxID=667306 RepID=UPI002003B997|nr:DNA replication/repair protein RecF [Aciditerrimonas ferrireducens]MCK4176991.1 DNA replication/repair protein RecF [Aciditerrimonas ferrireducens]